MNDFDLSCYLGKWYELVHSPSWFQHNDDYNTTATYIPLPDGRIKVINKTTNRGTEVVSNGHAIRLGLTDFRVDFSPSEVLKLASQQGYSYQGDNANDRVPNYVIKSVWKGSNYSIYKYAVVTDNENKAVYLLSRIPDPPAAEYAMLMDYISSHFNRNGIVQTPHYK
jgi:lipocalin